jgi:hypothetical protein
MPGASPLTRLFGTRVPPDFKRDVETINGTNLAALKKALPELEKVIFSHVPYSPPQVQDAVAKVVKTAGLSEDEGKVLLRLYTQLIPLVLTATDEAKLKESLVKSGVEEAKASTLSQSLYSHRQEVVTEVAPSLGERFGPTLSHVYWRVDQPVAGSEPFTKTPLAVVTLVLDDSTDTLSEGFEIDLATLDLLIEELGNARRELAKISSESK